MPHFEDFWNTAENIGSQLPDSPPEDIIAKIKLSLDKLIAMDKLPREQAIITGDILFDLCKLTLKYNINSAAALNFAVEIYKAQLYAPDEEDQQ
jgi:hypothetical protein